jgi:hypothetical protein
MIDMNHKQRRRAHERRRHHQEATKDPDRPRLIMTRDSYPAVERAHIVPRMYQKAFAVSGKVAVHVEGRAACRLLSTRKAGTRGAYYRRPRPSGQTIDDVEASLAAVEARSAPVLSATVAGAALTLEAKGVLAQFFAAQLMRGPAYFEQREEIIGPMIEELGMGDFRPAALAEAGGDVSVVRQKLLDAYLDPTQRLVTMLQQIGKIAGVLGNMRWHVLRFDDPVIAYSDHPVVVWPGDLPSATPFERQHVGPLDAIEVRVPVAPQRAILMNWLDQPDPDEIVLRSDVAAELNAFTISQADVEWMHTPGHEPPVAGGTFRPLSRLVETAYDADTVMRSQRRAHAADWLEKNKNRRWINDLKLIDLQFVIPPSADKA